MWREAVRCFGDVIGIDAAGQLKPCRRAKTTRPEWLVLVVYCSLIWIHFWPPQRQSLYFRYENPFSVILPPLSTVLPLSARR